MHTGITGQRSCRGQIIAPQHRGDDPIAIHFPDHGPVHKVDQTVLIDRDACVEQKGTSVDVYVNMNRGNYPTVFLDPKCQERWSVSSTGDVLVHLSVDCLQWDMNVTANVPLAHFLFPSLVLQ